MISSSRYLPGTLTRNCLLLLSLMLAGCQTLNTSNRDLVLTQNPASGSSSPDGSAPQSDFQIPVQENFYISPGDTVEIKFPYLPEMGDEYLVRTDGKISLPFLGSVMAAGLTPDELQAEIETGYNDIRQRGQNHTPENRSYHLNVADILDIRFVYQEEFNETVVVRPDGKISMSLIGTVIVAGKTPEQLSAELQTLYGKHLQEPELVVMVREFSVNEYYFEGQAFRPGLRNLEDPVVVVRNTKPLQFFVGGEVVRPGFFPYNGGVSALQAIIMAGGNKLSAEMRQVAIIRKGPGEQPQLLLRNLKTDVTQTDVGSLFIEDAANGDVILRPYDVVIVPKTNIAKITDYLDQYLYTMVPALRNISFGFIYNLNPVDSFTTETSTP